MTKPQAKIVHLSFGMYVAVDGTEAPGDEEWERYLSSLREIGPSESLLIFSWGGGPTMKQRRELDEAVKHHLGKVAVVTGSRVARGIVKAISWTGKDIRGFGFDRINDAFTYLDISESKRQQVLHYARLLAEELGLDQQSRLAS